MEFTFRFEANPASYRMVSAAPSAPTLLLFLFAFSLRANPAESISAYSIFRSHDQGRSWSRSDAGLPRTSRVNAFVSSGPNIIAGTDAGIFISSNRAGIWHKTSTLAAQSLRITSLATIKPSTGLTNLVFAGTYQGDLLASTDHGANWQRNLKFPVRNIRSLHALEGTLYVGTDSDRVYKSDDQGQSWTHLSAGLPALAQVFALTSVDGHLFAGLYAQGLY
ncbi:MAG TPA: hypothetical protein VM735_12180, partial [Candidatus Kapabacteria bacterium]|nr:hypothetical protein [Candidatus Kapabacteria bacterium]